MFFTSKYFYSFSTVARPRHLLGAVCAGVGFAVFASLFTACKTDSVPTVTPPTNAIGSLPAAGNYFPAKTGNYWVYTDGIEADTVRVVGDTLSNSKPYKKLVDVYHSRVFYTSTLDSVAYSRLEKIPSLAGDYNEYVELRTDKGVDKPWSDLRTSILGDSTRIESTIQALEPVRSVRGANFPNVVKIRRRYYRITNGKETQSGNTEYAWYAKDVGLVEYIGQGNNDKRLVTYFVQK